MANWRSYIDPSIGDGQNTIDGIIANGATYGLQISDDLNVTGLSTFSDTARFSNTIRLDGQLRDGDNNFGSSGQVLSSDGTDTRWINAGSLSAGAASQVAINDDSNTNAERFITLVDSSSGNNNVKTDASLKYNPSTNTITTVNITGNVTGNLTGNASSATVLQTARTIGGVSFNGSASINLPGVNQTGNQNTSGSSASCTGNAASATVLQTARTIGGVSFNGSANINLPGVNQTGNQNTSGNAATATVLETARNFSISGEITANNQSFNGSGNVTLSATVDDNVIDYDNLKASNRTTATNGQYLRKRSGNIGGMTWEDIPVVTGGNLTGNTLASGIVNSSLTSLGTLSGLSVNGNISVTTGAISGNGEGLTNLGANRLASGTIPDARFPSTLPAISGANLTNLDASDLSSGTVPAARLPNHSASLLTSGTIPAARLPNHSASLLTSGTIPDARISGNFLRSDQSDTLSGDLTVTGNIVIGDQIRIGDDAFIEDINVANTIRVKGNQDSNQGFIAFGSQSKKLGHSGASATLTYDGYTVWHSGNDGSGSGLSADFLDGQHGSHYLNYNNLSNKPTIPTQTSQLTNNSGFITGTDVRSMNEAASTGQSNTSSESYSDKVTLSISTVSNSRVLVFYSYEIKHSDTSNKLCRGRVTGSNTSFVGGNRDDSNKNTSFQRFNGNVLDISSHTGTRTYRIQFSRTSGGSGTIRNASLCAIEMSV